MNSKKQIGQRKWKIYLAIVIGATIFWFLAKINKKYDHIVDIPLKIILNNPDFTLKHPPPETVRVNIVGRGFDILRLPFYEPTFDIDLSAVEDTYVFPLNDFINNVRLPDELQVSVKSVITPHQIEFNLDKRASAKVPVKVVSRVRTQAGLIMVDASPVPDSVIITGPAAYVDTLTAILTEKAEHTDVAAAFREQLELVVDSSYYARLDYDKVAVFYNIQRLAEKQLTGVPVQVINVPSTYEVVPLPGFARVYTKGGEKILASAGSDDFRVVIDFKKDWRPGVDRISPTIETNLKIRHVEIIPPNYELIVQKKRSQK